MWEKVAFDANVLFDSDSSALRPAGRDTLDQFVGKIHGLDSQSIVAIGYADRMGSEASNQTLSQQRVRPREVERERRDPAEHVRG